MVASSPQWTSSTTTTFSGPGPLTWRSRARKAHPYVPRGAVVQQLAAQLSGQVVHGPERRGVYRPSHAPRSCGITRSRWNRSNSAVLADARLPAEATSAVAELASAA